MIVNSHSITAPHPFALELGDADEAAKAAASDGFTTALDATSAENSEFEGSELSGMTVGGAEEVAPMPRPSRAEDRGGLAALWAGGASESGAQAAGAAGMIAMPSPAPKPVSSLAEVAGSIAVTGPISFDLADADAPAHLESIRLAAAGRAVETGPVPPAAVRGPVPPAADSAGRPFDLGRDLDAITGARLGLAAVALAAKTEAVDLPPAALAEGGMRGAAAEPFAPPGLEIAAAAVLGGGLRAGVEAPRGNAEPAPSAGPPVEMKAWAALVGALRPVGSNAALAAASPSADVFGSAHGSLGPMRPGLPGPTDFTPKLSSPDVKMGAKGESAPAALRSQIAIAPAPVSAPVATPVSFSAPPSPPSPPPLAAPVASLVAAYTPVAAGDATVNSTITAGPAATIATGGLRPIAAPTERVLRAAGDRVDAAAWASGATGVPTRGEAPGVLTSSAPVTPPPPTQIAQQIAHQMALAPLQAQRQFEISLAPRELGRLRIALVEGHGALNVTIQAERGETLDLLRRNIAALAEEFTALGYAGSSFSFDHFSGGASERDAAPTEAATVAPRGVTAGNGAAAVDRPTPPPGPPRMADGGLDLRM